MSEKDPMEMKRSVTATAEPVGKPVRRHRVWRALGWIFGSLVLLLVLIVVGLTWYTSTADFQRRAGGEVVKVLEDSTGGRVELQRVSFSLWHLAIEADGLVIHGTEGPKELPYLSAAKIFVRLHLNMVLTHLRGVGPQSRISLRYLRVEEPKVHLIIDKDGKTNQPVPKHPTTSSEPLQDTLLDLQARKVELVNGLAVLNDRAIPFDLAAEDLNAGVVYLKKTDRYGITVDLKDLRTKMGARPEVQSKLHVEGEIGRDMAQLKSFDFMTGTSTHLVADAELQHFAKPVWQAEINGSVELKQVNYLAGVDGLDAGTLDLSVHGHNCSVTPQVAQKRPHFWQRKAAPSAKVLPPDPECKEGYLLAGVMKLNHAGYSNEYVRFHDINGGAQLHITPRELLFTALTGYLPGGGSVKGELKIENWLGETEPGTAPRSATVAAAATTANTGAKSVGAAPLVDAKKATPQVQRAQAYMTVTVDRIPLRTIMDTTAPPHYGDLGLDTSITGPVQVEWGGPAADIASSVQVEAGLTFTPTGVKRKGALTNVPISGTANAHYDGKTEVVNIQQIALRTPETTLDAHGVLGVSDGDPLTSLQVNLQAHDLAEYNGLLTTLGLEANGKKGSAAIPVVLHGTLGFEGTAKGRIADLDVKGRLVADNFALQLGTTADVHIDALEANGEYSPNEGVAVASSTIRQGTAVLNVAGSFRPRKVVSRRGVVTYVWDNEMSLDATAKLASAQLTDLLQIAGQQDKVPVTGTVALDVHAYGTPKALNGGGNITLNNGVAYGESYQTISVDAKLQGQQVDASRVFVQAHGMTVSGNGGYNLASKKIEAKLAGDHLQLSKLDVVKKASPDTDGVLSFSADANGTLEEPALHAKLSLTQVQVGGKTLGDVNATAYSMGSTVFYELGSNVIGAKAELKGQTSLLAGYSTQAKLTLTGLDAEKAVALFAPGSVKASSNVAATITVSGQVARPQELTGTAEFGQLDVTLQGVELKEVEPLRATLKSGVVTLEQFHITGQDTDLKAGGTVQVLGNASSAQDKLNLNASGDVSMALAHTFDPELTTSGKVTFKMAATGTMQKPSLSGDVQVQNVNLAMEGIANGLSNLNGTLMFNEDRLDVKNLVGTTGGGQVKINGYLAYQKGLFADLTATGDTVRVRLNGLSATANASLRLQGGPQSTLLSGTVLVTRFGVGPDVDFAAFAGSGGVQAPPPPDSLTNKIRLDVRVTSAPQLDFQNSYAKLAGTVDLTVRGTVAVPSVLGRIQITEGSATYAGTTYQLQRGSIYFSNPVRIEPTIDLDATARVENYDLTIGLHGTPSSLKPTYRSEPPLSEADIFNLLALGRTQEEAQLYQEQQVQAGTDPTTNALLGGALNATVGSRVGKLFGAGSVKIDPSFVGTLGNSAARITVQEPLSKQLTLVFATNVNQSAQQLIQVQYQLNANNSIVATRDESGVFSVVYKVRKRYK